MTSYLDHRKKLKAQVEELCCIKGLTVTEVADELGESEQLISLLVEELTVENEETRAVDIRRSNNLIVEAIAEHSCTEAELQESLRAAAKGLMDVMIHEGAGYMEREMVLNLNRQANTISQLQTAFFGKGATNNIQVNSQSNPWEGLRKLISEEGSDED